MDIKEIAFWVILILLFLISSAKASSSTLDTSAGFSSISIVSQTYIDTVFEWNFININGTRWIATFRIDPAFWNSTKTCLGQTGASRNACFQNLCTSNPALQVNCSNLNNRTKLAADLANMSSYPLTNLTGNIKFSGFVIDTANGNGTFYIDFTNGFKTGQSAKFGFGSTVVNTTTQPYEVTMSSNQRYFYVSETGLHWAFYSNTTVTNAMKYSTSPDGTTWTFRGMVANAGVGWQADIWVNGTNISYARFNSNTQNGGVQYRLGNLNSDGTITWAAAEQTFATTATYIGMGGISITLNSTGHPWVEYKNTTAGGGSGTPWVASSSTNNGTWTTDVSYQVSTVSKYHGLRILPLSNGKMLAIYAQPGATIGAKLWNGTAWGSLVNTTSKASSAWTNLNTNGVEFGAVQDPTNPDLVDMVFVNNTQYSLIFTQYNSTTNTWNATETVVNTSLTSTSGVALSSVSNGDLYAFWINSTTKVVYNKYTASSGTWAAATTLVSDTGITATFNIMSSYNASDYNISVVYMNNSASPYNIKYNILNISTPATVNYTRNCSDSIIYSDSDSRNTTLIRSSSDYFTFSDTDARNTTLIRSSSDYLIFIDSDSRNITLIRIASDMWIFIDSTKYNGTYSRFISEYLAFIDTTSRNTTSLRSVADYLAFIDSASRGFEINRTIYDSMVFSDTALRNATFARSSSDYIVFIDSTAINGSYSRIISDFLAFQDATARNASLSITTSDFIAFVDSTSEYRELLRIASDFMTFIDSTERIKEMLRMASDYLVFADLTNRTIEVQLVNITYVGNSVILTCNATSAQNLTNASLYITLNGSWVADQTVNVSGTSAQANFTKTLDNGVYVWNCEWCTATNCSLAPRNNTLLFNLPLPTGGGLTLNPEGGDVSMIGVLAFAALALGFAYFSVNQKEDTWQMLFFFISLFFMYATLNMAIVTLAASNKVVTSSVYNSSTNSYNFTYGNVTDTAPQQGMLATMINPVVWVIVIILAFTIIFLIFSAIRYMANRRRK